MLRGISLVAMGAMLSSGAAMGAPVFLVTQGDTLYRTDGGAIESFVLDDDITGMTAAPDGTVWASSRTDNDGDGFGELYQLSDPLGPNPALTFWGDFLEGPTPTLSMIDGALYGFQKVAHKPLEEGRLVRIDYDARLQMTVGDTGMLGVAAGGFGYDSGNDVLYAIARRPEAALYTVDYDLSDGPDPTATLVGPLGIEMRKHGADFFEGTLYAAAQYRGGPLALGSIDTLTGSFHELMLVGPRAREDIALAIVPEPASLGLLGLGALALLRYRRA